MAPLVGGWPLAPAATRRLLLANLANNAGEASTATTLDKAHAVFFIFDWVSKSDVGSLAFLTPRMLNEPFLLDCRTRCEILQYFGHVLREKYSPNLVPRPGIPQVVPWFFPLL